MSLAQSSTATRQRTARSALEIIRCEQCQAHYPYSDSPTATHSYGFNRRFCRRACKYRQHAQDALDAIQGEHRYCASCYRELKKVHAPTLKRKSAKKGKSIPECAIGRQSYFDWAVEDQRNERGDPPSDRPHHTPEMRVRPTCVCPANHHDARRPFTGRATLSKPDAIEHTKRLVAALDKLDGRGVHELDYRENVLFEYVRGAKRKNLYQNRDDRAMFRDGLALAIRESG